MERVYPLLIVALVFFIAFTNDDMWAKIGCCTLAVVGLLYMAEVNVEDDDQSNCSN